MIGTLILLRKNRIKNIMVNIGTIEGVAVAEVGVAVEAETTKGVEVWIWIFLDFNSKANLDLRDERQCI